mmetsp:Transcript_24970/g.59355  ORF Transcript_24970/g.59355 Transcript_24970/m.59355 type:complete len:151 (+) Transcript_24970:705-1157(+)
MASKSPIIGCFPRCFTSKDCHLNDDFESRKLIMTSIEPNIPAQNPKTQSATNISLSLFQKVPVLLVSPLLLFELFSIYLSNHSVSSKKQHIPREKRTEVIPRSGRKHKIFATDPTLSIGERNDIHVFNVRRTKGVEDVTKYAKYNTENTS